jgi:opacity protein-like surface antigen
MQKLMGRFLLMTVLTLGCAGAVAQTTAAVSVYGAFSGATDSNGTIQSPSNAAGAMVELRHIQNPLIGYEATYSWNRANQAYNATTQVVCGVCAATTTWTSVPSNAHEVTGDWVVSLRVLNLRPFALAGGGMLLNVPSSGSATTTTNTTSCGTAPGCTTGYSTTTTATRSETKGVLVYGAGLDWGVLPHLGLRFQYRGNLYKAPDLSRVYTSTDKFTHTAEPMIGAYFRF